MTKSVIIVGGGSAGWMSAATLAHYFPDMIISVIESPDVPIAGVGESTLQHIRPWMKALGIEEEDFMVPTDATYKSSIKYVDFYKKGDGGFHNPLSQPLVRKDLLGLNDWQLKKYYYPDTHNQEYCRDFYPIVTFLEKNKIYDGTDLDSYNFDRDTAYHFDAVKFGAWLKDSYCIPRKVRHIPANVEEVIIGEDGIDALKLDMGFSISADLYIDCTGFKSILMNALHVPFTSYNDTIPNNRAWATKIAYKDRDSQMEPFTCCTAIDNGWVWNIPLWSRIGTGYVYDDTTISPDDAKKEFCEYLGTEDVDLTDIQMRVGILTDPWYKNCVAIGLAAGFIEPLNSSGLFTVHEFLLTLVKSLNRERYTQWDIDVYNVTVKKMFDKFASFVALHYALSIRNDTPYWKKVTSNRYLFEGVDDGYNELAHRQMNYIDHPLVGIHPICIGMNYRMMDASAIDWYKWNYPGMNHGDENADELKRLIDRFSDNKQQLRERYSKMERSAPTMYRYIRNKYYN